MNETHKLVVKTYHTSAGKEPFTQWLASIPDQITRGRIEIEIDKVENGNMGDWERLVVVQC